jgi:uncharacterized damage-inducible protein DinB
MKHVIAVAALALAVAVPVVAQTAPPAAAQAPAATAQATAPAGPTDPLSRALFAMYTTQKNNYIQSAEKVSEADFAFQPTKDVRTFGQLLGHAANSSFSTCASIKGEPNPNKDNFEQTATTKATLVKAVADTFAYCDPAFAGLTDAKLMEMVKAGQNDVPRARYPISMIAHLNEHYGNLVTYMRIKGYVPPSTERAQQMRR